ncbi:MAG: Crp/Fnr family transcriptional regulator [Hyphomicrobiales bacterium]|nr:Crp/Fnr family transcriptional regulator [Hyphomicrobiales bacterium]
MEFGDTVKVLRVIPLFAKLDPTKIKLIAFASEYLTVEDGEELFHEGDQADGVYLIDAGTAEIWLSAEDAEVLVGELSDHDVIGEMAIFRNEPRSATIRARGTLKVLRVDADMFLSVVTQNADAALSVMRILSEKLALAADRERELANRINELEAT